MPPRYSYWTILADGLPTAFRAAERADLLPTFNRIRDKHPDAEMKWFARGRLWTSPEDAQADLQRARLRRDRDWRPGGEHRDPRQRIKNRPKPKPDAARRERQPPRSSARPAAPARPAGPARSSARPAGPARPASPARSSTRPAGPARPPGSARPSTRPAGPARERPARPPRKRQR